MLLMLEDLIDPDFQTYQELHEINRLFPDKNNVFFIVRPHSSDEQLVHTLFPSKQNICDLRAWIQKELIVQPGLKKVFTSFGVRTPSINNAFFNFDPILEVDCGRPLLDESEKIKTAFSSLRASPWRALLSSPKHNDLVVNVYIDDSPVESRYGSYDVSIVENLKKNLEKNYFQTNSNVDIIWSGIGTYQYYLKQGYDSAALLNVASSFIVFMVFWILFKSWRSGALFLGTFTLAVLPVYGLMAAFGHPIDSLTNSLSLLILIASLEDFLLICLISTKPRYSIYSSFRQLLVPSFFTSLTTIVGFGSLCISQVAIIRRFGLWAAVGSFLEWYMVFIFLPAALHAFKNLKRWLPDRQNSQINDRSKWSSSFANLRLPKKVAIVFLSVFFIDAIFINKLKISDAPERIFPEDHIVRKTSVIIEKSRGWKSDLSLVFANSRSVSDNTKILEQIKKDPLVGGIESPYEIETYLQSFVSPPETKELVHQLWKKSSVAKRLVNSDENRSRAILYVRSTDIVEVNALRARLNTICQNRCYAGGTLISYGEFGSKILSTLLESLALSLIIVVLIILFIAKSLKQNFLWQNIISAIWGPATLLAVFIAFKIDVFFVSSIVASILVGLAGDNTIQYLFAAHKKDLDFGLQKFGGATVILCSSMILLSSVLLFSYFGALRILGGLMIAGFVFTLIGELWILKSLTQSSSQSKIQTKEIIT